MEDKTISDKELKTGAKAIWRHAKPFKGTLVALFVLGIISAIANGFVPFVTGKFFDALVSVSEHKSALQAGLPLWLFLLIAWTIVQLVANNIDWISDRIGRKVKLGIQLNVESSGLIHLFKLPITYHKNAHLNGDIQKLGSAGWRISAIINSIVTLMPQFLSIIIGFVLAMTINKMMAWVLVAGVALYILSLIKILRPIAAIDSAARHKWSDSWDDAAQAVQQVESLKQAVAEEYETERVKTGFLKDVMNMWSKVEITWSNVGFFQRSIVFLTQLAIFSLSIHLVATSAMSIGQLIALNGYALMFFGPFVALGYQWQTIQNGITTAAHAEEIFDKKEEVYNPSGSVSQEQVAGNIDFKHVYFNYGENQPSVLTDIDFTIKAGEIVAFVGESGVGKSTTISLISGYYFPSQGEVLVDGIDTRKWNLSNLRKHIAVVPQEVALFNDSIKTNIAYGSFNASDEDIFKAAKEAHIDEFIRTLPKGYDSLVGERGIKLSVGQKQRVAIARAILRNPSILILDEPTSALDSQTEKIVTTELEKLMHNRTTLIIAHRLSTVRKANKILVFEKGKIVEVGTHNELIQKENGVYRKLYEYQIGLHE